MFKALKFSFVALISIFVIACSGKKSGETTEEAPAAAEMVEEKDASSLVDGTYAFDTENSKVNWHATKITGEHNGTVDLSEGSFTVSNGSISSGTIQLDLNSIYVIDLEGKEEMQTKLTNHLKSADFFNVELSPVATLEITSVEKSAEADATHTLNGTLTIKEIKKEVAIPATISQEGDAIKTSAKFKLDRTKWDMMFHSGFEQWGDKTINDEFDVEFDLTASKTAM
ncbi:YceI family protein [Flexithrix dorotheae]|uniref:YceI family protein n=1 Tax=Flexithrix dorotheae TaxID=70993 RepID=UPI00037759BB|nr:YceI family protein [Flexithrix dorotheae]